MNKKALKQILIFHAVLIAAALTFPLYRAVARFVGFLFPSCILHDLFHIYCPLCGGTRAISALLSFHFREALQYNAYVVFLTALFLVYDVIAWVRLLMGKEKLFVCRKAFWIAIGVGLLLFGVLRNVLLIHFGYDPIGDLILFWT